MKVKVNKGLTINLGNFESARVDIGIERDIEPGEDLENAFLSVSHEVDLELKQQTEDIRKRYKK